MRNRRRGLIPLAAGLLLMAAALGLTAYNLWDSGRAAASVREGSRQLEALIPRQDGAEGICPDYVLNPDMEMPTVELDGRDYIGLLEIPALGLSLPVQSRWSYPNLKISPCRYTGSAYLDNLIIAAHNYPTHFGSIKTLAAGDEVRFTDGNGSVFSYRVSEVAQFEPTAVSEIQSGDWALTLFTCTIGGQYRVVVRCVRN